VEEQIRDLNMSLDTEEPRPVMPGLVQVKPGHDRCESRAVDPPDSDAACLATIAIARLDPAIHLFNKLLRRVMDARVKPGHDQ
jgi:hypothetical protein